jgi:hypothetical protein
MTAMSSEAGERDSRAIVWCVLVACALMLGFMTRPLFTRLLPFTGDLLHFHYPLRDFYSRALTAGQPFDWMPSLFNGLYLVGEGQLGGYHPLHLLLYRFLPLDRAFVLEVVAAYPFLFAGMLLFLRRWCGLAPAAFGAMLFTFGGFSLSHGVHPNMVGVVAHLPWLLWAIHLSVEATDWRRRASSCAAIGLLTGSQLLLGHPQALWLSALAELAYAAVLLAMSPAMSKRWSPLAIVVGWLLGAGVGAVQLLPTLHAVSHSVRLGYDATFAESFSLPPVYLLQLFAPYLFWGRILRWNEAPGANDEFAVYGGAVALVLAAWWLASSAARRWRGETSTIDRFGLCVAAFGLLGLWLAIGSYGQLYHLQTLLPLVGRFRVPARFVLFSQFAIAILATLAVRQLLQPTTRSALASRAGWAPWLAAGASVAVAGWFASTATAPATSQATVAIAAGPMLFIVAAALLTLALRGWRPALIALVIVAACDQAIYGLGGVIGWQDFIARRELLALVSEQRLIPPEAGRIAYAGFPNIYTLAGYRLLEGYVGLAPARQLDYASPQALRVAQVAFANERFIASARQVAATPVGKKWYATPAPLPRARLLTHARVSTQPAVDLLDINVDNTALTAHAVTIGDGPVGEAKLVADEPGMLQIATLASTAQLLVIAESYDDGWRA